jgi:hypothetical protein
MRGELFGSVQEEASEFFQRGALSCSPAHGSSGLDGVRLLSERWDAMPVSVLDMNSSLFDDRRLFPAGPACSTRDSSCVTSQSAGPPKGAFSQDAQLRTSDTEAVTRAASNQTAQPPGSERSMASSMHWAGDSTNSSGC